MKMYSLDSVDIPYDNSWRKVAIAVSGGADSALLAYILCVLLSEDCEIHVISHVRCWKTKPWQKYDSINVYSWLLEKFPNKRFKRHINFIPPELEYGSTGPTLIDEYNKQVSGDNIEQRAFAEYVCTSNDIEAFYNAVTRNPKNIDLGGMLERNIDRNDNNEHLSIMRHMDRWAIHPFRFVEKNWIIAQYKRLEITDLLEITRSCEGTFENLNYKNYVPGQYVPVCGACFWCKEREWAIEQNK